MFSNSFFAGLEVVSTSIADAYSIKIFICQVTGNRGQKNFCEERLDLGKAIARSFNAIMGILGSNPHV